MVKWENDKNVYILGAALAALNASITNEIAESVIAGWRKFSFSFLLLLLSRLDHNFFVFFFSSALCSFSRCLFLLHALPLMACHLVKFFFPLSHRENNSLITWWSVSNYHSRRSTHPPRRQRPNQETVFLCYNHHHRNRQKDRRQES